MNEGMNAWRNEWIKEKRDDKMVDTYEWTEWWYRLMNEWKDEQTNELKKEWEKINVWMNELKYEWMSEWVISQEAVVFHIHYKELQLNPSWSAGFVHRFVT